MLLLHDLASHPRAWADVNTATSRLPLKELSVTVPLQIYMPYLRNHGDGEWVNSSSTADYLEDVVNFAENVVEPASPVHVVGHGFGGRLALLAALALPDKFASVTVLCGSDPLDSLPPCDAHVDGLREAFNGAKTLPDVADALKKLLPEAEKDALAPLVMNVLETRRPAGRELSLKLNDREVATAFGTGSKHLAWPQLCAADGSEASARDAAASLSPAVAKTPCQIIHSVGAVINKERLQRLFPAATFTAMPATFSSRIVRKEDAEVVAHAVLDKAGLLTATGALGEGAAAAEGTA